MTEHQINNIVFIRNARKTAGAKAGYIRDPDVAHEEANTIIQEYYGKGVPLGVVPKKDRSKSPYDELEKRSKDYLLTHQASETVKAQRDAMTDGLTLFHSKSSAPDLINRDLEALNERRMPPFGIIRGDLDMFSWVNDILKGHKFGDMYLKVFSDIIRAKMGHGDRGFRVGGDEFLFQVFVRDPKILEAIMERFTTATSENSILNGTLQVIKKAEDMVVTGVKRDIYRTVTVKEMLRDGINDLQQNAKSRRHFMRKGRGDKSLKRQFIASVKEINTSKYNEYLTDTRTWDELTSTEKVQRKLLECEILDIIGSLFPHMGVSLSGVLLTPGQETTYEHISQVLDKDVYDIKANGGAMSHMTIA